MKAYYLTTELTAETVGLEQDVLDYDVQKGYQAEPGYVGRAIEILRGEREPTLSAFHVCLGSRMDDLVTGTILGQYFISHKCAEIFRRENIRGFRTIDAQVKDPLGQFLDYKRLIVTGRCSKIRQDFEDDETADLDDYTWAGNKTDDDIVVPEDSAAILCFERLEKVIKNHRLQIELSEINLKTVR